MIPFYLAVAALVVAALALLLRPWWPGSRGVAGADALPALNVAVHRDRLADLERDRSNGTLAADDLGEAREELQRQLLEDTAAGEVAPADRRSRSSAAAIALLLPVIAVGAYMFLGSPAAVLPVEAQTQRAAVEMEQLTASLAGKLERNPDNPEGWAMLARSYKALGRLDDAERAFGRIGPPLDRNAELLAELAELLVQKEEGFGPRSRELIQRALRLEPNNMLALFLGGGEAFGRGRYAEAAALWEKLLPQLDAQGDDARMVASSIARARERGGAAASRRGVPQDEAHRAAGQASPGTSAAAATAVSGRVELSAALKDKVGPDDAVFIFARAVDGPRMPLAAKRVRAADLPLDFTLDDTQAVMPGARLSAANLVRVEARVSKSGQATPGKGDLTGKSGAVKPGAKGLRVVVDHVEP